MPVTQLASVEAPRQLAEAQPVALLPEEVPLAPVVPVYPVKQARN
jgi:hypothetical protein